MLSTQIEIAAPPEVVREKFLQFSKIPTYSPNGFIKSLTPAIPNKPVEAGDTITTVLNGATFTPVILENSPTTFRWLGTLKNLGWLFRGEHIFRFLPSETSKGHTTFVQEEVFMGLLAGIMGEGIIARWIGMREKTERGFVGYNVDFRAWVEQGESAE